MLYRDVSWPHLVWKFPDLIIIIPTLWLDFVHTLQICTLKLRPQSTVFSEIIILELYQTINSQSNNLDLFFIDLNEEKNHFPNLESAFFSLLVTKSSPFKELQ